MEINNLIDRLALQVQSNQEGFDVLSKSKNLKEIAKHFSRILRGTLLTTESAIYLKGNKINSWTSLFSSLKQELSIEKLIDNSNNQSIKIIKIKKKEFLLCIAHLHDKSHLSILIGSKFDRTSFTNFDKISFQILLQLFDNAYQAYLSGKKEKDLVFSLNHKVMQLNNLIDTGIELSKLGKSDSLFEQSLERLATLTNASKVYFSITKNNAAQLELTFPFKFRLEDISPSEMKLENNFKENGNTYSWILAEKETRKGTINFDETDKLLLDAVSRQVQAAIENAKLHQEALEKETIEKELAVAGDIQKKILPESLPTIEGYDLAGFNVPSKEVGGDYYNVIKLKDGRYALIIADVAGKGVPAALLVSTLDAALHAFLGMQIPLDEMAKKINTIIFKSSPPDKFITFFIAILNPANGELDIVNAGHNPSLRLDTKNKMSKIEAGGIAFGMFDMGLPFEGEKLKINKGERLFLYTDGIPEAMNSKEEEYSDEKMEKFFQKNRPKKSQTFVKNIVTDVKKHTGRTPQSDDITLLYLIRK
ncbi:MAG: PP2C family protein-serine/threonine phosphatase [Ignavibacteriae bacterium]|nr:PP2C family protein-serine/threonine phosphatase [Ignavibacteriota bacterium]